MKLIKYYMLLLTLLSNSIFSQSIESRFKYGVSVGIGGSTGIVVNDHVDKNKFTGFSTWQMSYSAGAKLEVSLFNNNSLVLGLEFSKMGDKSETYPPDISRFIFSNHQFKTEIYSISLPVVWRKELGSLYFIDFGGSGDYHFPSRLYIDWLNDNSSFNEVDANIERQMNVSTILGLGRKWTFDNYEMDLSVNYDISIFSNSLNLDFGNKLPNRSFNRLELNFNLWF